MPTLAEDLLLVLLDDVSGKPQTDSNSLDYALAGAVLADLALADRIEVVEGSGLFRHSTVQVVDESPTGDEVLDEACRLVGEKARRPEQLVPKISKGLRKQLLARLEQRGILQHDATRVLGIFPRNRWPAQDASAEQALRQRLYDVLVVGTTPDDRTGALIALLNAIDQAHKVLAGDRVERKAVKARAKSLAEGAWAAAAVRKAVQAARSAAAACSAGAGAVVSVSV